MHERFVNRKGGQGPLGGPLGSDRPRGLYSNKKLTIWPRKNGLKRHFWGLNGQSKKKTFLNKDHDSGLHEDQELYA
jgi:hypothetical protein